MVPRADSGCQINAGETLTSQIGLEEYRDYAATIRTLTLF
jgi:hypothetical protein